MGRLVLLFAFGLLALTACGSGSKPAATSRQCRHQATALARIDHDIAAMKLAKTEQTMSTLTDRFLLHVDTAPITNLQRNRLIDHAAALVSIKCPQCFQALEAERPIPAIRAGDLKCS